MSNIEISTNTEVRNTTNKSAGWRLLREFSSQSKKIALILILLFLSCLSYAVIPMLIAQAIDQLLPIVNQANASITTVFMALKFPLFGLLASAMLCSSLGYWQQYLVADVGEQVTCHLRMKLSDKLTKLPISYFDANPKGEVLSRFTNDLERISEVIQVGLMQFLSSLITITLTIGMMLWLNVNLSIVVFITLILCALATKFVSKLNQHYFLQNQKILGQLNSKVEEFFSCQELIKTLNFEQRANQQIEILNEKQYQANRKAQLVNYAIYPTIRLLQQLGFIMTAVFGGYLAFQGVMTIGIVQAFLQYVNQLAEPITEFSYVMNSLQAAIASATRVYEVLDAQEEMDEPSKLTLSTCRGEVRFDHVSFGYTSEKQVMKQMDFNVQAGETIAIVGPTGGGKTTIINLLMRFYSPNQGKILMDNLDIQKLSRAEVRAQIGMVLQDPWLFKGTIRENISYGKMDATIEEVVEAAKKASCDHFIRTLPQGYDTIINSEDSVLSQGQIQLLTIARTMLQDPAIMILDEATSSVDTKTEVEIQAAMNRMMKGKTCFVIAHRLSTIRNANRIFVIKEGELIEQGSHSQLLQRQGFYATLYASQFANNTTY